MLTYVCVCVYRDELCFLYISLVYIYIFIINYSSYNLMTCCCFCSLSTFFKCVSLCILYDYYENTYMYVCVSRYKSCFYNSSTGACKIAGVYVMIYMYIMFPRSSSFNSPSLFFYLYKNSIWLYKIGSKIYKISYKASSKGSSDYSMHFLLTRLNWDLKTESDKRDKLTMFAWLDIVWL